MEALLRRLWLFPYSTIGELSASGEFECFTLEDVVRLSGVKVPGKTAIPVGRYELIITFSQRFQHELPLLLNVPNFSGIRIHAGNTDQDTDGCILVGQERHEGYLGKGYIGKSKAALAALIPKLTESLKAGRCFITVEDTFKDPTRGSGVSGAVTSN